MIRCLLLIFIAFLSIQVRSQSLQSIDLSNNIWHCWLDTSAIWEEDPLFGPNTSLEKIPSNPPSCGWKSLLNQKSKTTQLPATVEELFSQGKAEWRYHGVSWFWTSFTIPENLAKQNLFLQVNGARLRLEIYINEQLAGYDMVAETFYKVDVTRFIKPGEENCIAFRITNPGGQRGWSDFPDISWGEHSIPASHDFAGIGGSVELHSVPNVYVDHIFIKNLKPHTSKTVKVISSITNKMLARDSVQVEIAIHEAHTNKRIFRKLLSYQLDGKPNQQLSTTIKLPNAQLWDYDNPNLYRCQYTIKSKEDQHVIDAIFGLRVVEARVSEEGHNFFLNGKRIRLRSAIDWGYYALTGLYPDSSMARKSIQAAKDIGHNSISFHRRIGEPLVLQFADEMGLYLYEEPGGFHGGGGIYMIEENTLAAAIMEEKCRRMVIRDRNHPSLLFYNICNEDRGWTPLREKVMRMMAEMDGTRFVFNSSGGNRGRWTEDLHHIRPYEKQVRTDFNDNHTVTSDSRFKEKDLMSHQWHKDSSLLLFGEVRCYTGPDNAAMITENRSSGYDFNVFHPMSEKVNYFFDRYRPDTTGSRVITGPEMLSRQAGRGLMYINGRLGQALMINNEQDGYAINGWSGGSYVDDEWITEYFRERDQVYREGYWTWASALVDEGRNLKGIASDLKHWVREKQVAILRKNGKYFHPADTILFDIHLINEGHIPYGPYQLHIRMSDGAGETVERREKIAVEVQGDEVYAQEIAINYPIIAKRSWRPGYLTIHAELRKGDSVVADGTEQVLLQNRAGFRSLDDQNILVHQWPEARKALMEAGVDLQTQMKSAEIILAKEKISDRKLKRIIKKVQSGASLILPFDEMWAYQLYQSGILSEPVTQWGGEQTGKWTGNGWGYLDLVSNNRAIPSGPVVGTNSWEVPSDPVGFWPFESDHPLKVHGAYVARPDTVLVLYGEITLGRGRIILLPGYPIGQNTAFCDLFFFNTLSRR